MKRRAIFAVVALLLSFGAVKDEARADAILFPWVVTSDSVVTVISVVNHTDAAAADKLHLAYFYKKTTANTNTEACDEVNFEVPTTFEDVVSFDVNAQLATKGGPLFNDATNYAGANFSMNIVKPRRAFLIVDNRVTDGSFVEEGGLNNNGDSLYGEAMVIELGAGAAWGYRAYNSADNNWLNPDFSNSQEVHGEVLHTEDRTPTTILPPSQWVTRFFITPVGEGQDTGNMNAGFRLYAIWDRDENPISGGLDNEIVCTGTLDVASNVLLSEGSYNRIKDQGGWTFVDTRHGDASGDVEHVFDACVMKLEYNLGGSVGGVTVPGIVNTAVWLTDNTYDNWAGGNDAVNPTY